MQADNVGVAFGVNEPVKAHNATVSNGAQPAVHLINSSFRCLPEDVLDNLVATFSPSDPSPGTPQWAVSLAVALTGVRVRRPAWRRFSHSAQAAPPLHERITPRTAMPGRPGTSTRMHAVFVAIVGAGCLAFYCRCSSCYVKLYNAEDNDTLPPPPYLRRPRPFDPSMVRLSLESVTGYAAAVFACKPRPPAGVCTTRTQMRCVHARKPRGPR
jgi:hypothetical protein